MLSFIHVNLPYFLKSESLKLLREFETFGLQSSLQQFSIYLHTRKHIYNVGKGSQSQVVLFT